MGTLRWLVDKRVILITNVGELTHEKLQQDTIDINQLISSGESPIHVISDSRLVTRAPISIGTIKDIFKGTKMEKAGHVVIVTDNPLLQFTSRLAAHFGGSKSYGVTKTVVEAINLLQKIDASLPEHIPYDEGQALD